MASCLRVKAIFQAVSQGCGCRRLRLTAIQPLSFLAAQQGKNKPLLDQSQLTCLVRTPHSRPETTFSKKRRKFKARHEEDGVSKDMTLVYENNMNRLNFWGQLIVNTLAIPVYGLSINIIVSNWPLQNLSITSGPLTALVYLFSYSALLIGVNNIGRRNIHRIYTDAEVAHLAAVVQDWKMTRHTVHFQLAAAERKPPGRVFGAFFGNVMIKGQSYLVIPSDFVQPRFYNLLMGYDLQRSVDHDVVKDIDIRDTLRNAAESLKKHSKTGR